MKTYDYKTMLHRHPQLWEFIKSFIEENKIKSVLEIGGGYAWIPKYGIKDYVSIDINEKVQALNQKRYPQFEFVVEDFADTFPLVYRDRFDAIFAIGVIEHTPRWKEFLQNIVDIRPKYAIVTFFNGLNNKKPAYRLVTKRGVEHCHLYHHTKHEILSYLKEIGVEDSEYEIFDIPQNNKKYPTETILMLEFDGR